MAFPRRPFPSRPKLKRSSAFAPLIHGLIISSTSSAEPKSSSCLGFTLVHQVLAGCCEPLLEVGPSRRYLCRYFSRCLAPYHGETLCCYCPLPHTERRPLPRYNKVGSHNTRTAASVRTSFRGCKHSFMFRPLPLLATLTAPTNASMIHSSGDFYFRTYHGSLPPRVPDILAVRTGQLTAEDLNPIKSAALSAVPMTPSRERVSISIKSTGAVRLC